MKWYWILLIFFSSFFTVCAIFIPSDFISSLQIVIDLFLTGETSPTVVINPILKGIIIALGFLTQFVIFTLFFSLILRYFITRRINFRLLLDRIPIDLPIRQILVTLFLSITIASTMIFKYVEGETWLNAIYFTFVTIATVGYGDVVASHPVTKVSAIILIINGISFIGISSQFLVDRIIKLQIQTKDNIPYHPISWEGHIIIGGQGSKGRKLTQLFLERQYKVIVIDNDPNRIKPATTSTLRVINGDITKSSLLHLLNLNDAAGLFLLLSDDNQTIHAGIVARSLAPDLDIYAEMMTSQSYEMARYAGINRPISAFHFMVNVINANVAHQNKYLHGSISDLKTYEGQLAFLIVPQEFDANELFTDVLQIGCVDLLLNGFALSYDPMLFSRFDKLQELQEKARRFGSHVLLAVDKEELFDKKKVEQFMIQPISHKRLIFAGFPDFADEFVNRLGIPPENTIFLYQNQSERELLETKEYTNFEWTLENGITLLDRIVQEDDLVICTFDDITSSLLLGVAIKNLDRKAHLIQLAPYEFDIEPLVQVGAEAVITPQSIISEAMLNSFAKVNILPPSLIFVDGHVFEHLVYANDSFHLRKVSDLNNRGIKVLYINRADESQFIEAVGSDRLHENDRIVVYASS